MKIKGTKVRKPAQVDQEPNFYNMPYVRPMALSNDLERDIPDYLRRRKCRFRSDKLSLSGNTTPTFAASSTTTTATGSFLSNLLIRKNDPYSQHKQGELSQLHQRQYLLATETEPLPIKPWPPSSSQMTK
jgi:hypothetical protein